MTYLSVYVCINPFTYKEVLVKDQDIDDPVTILCILLIYVSPKTMYSLVLLNEKWYEYSRTQVPKTGLKFLVVIFRVGLKHVT